MSWRPIAEPLLPWVRTLDRIMVAERPPRVRGEDLFIASDYGGVAAPFSYRVDVFVCADIQYAQRWDMLRRDVRRSFLADGRRMSYKGLGDRQRADALIPFLTAAREISGLCLAFITRRSVRHLCFPKSELAKLRQEAGLQASWKDDNLDNALRIVHLVSCLVGGLAHPNQNVYWVSDEDSVMASTHHQADVATLLSKFSSHYVRHPLGELGVGTTRIDEGDRLEEDLAAVADLVAGGLAEVTSRVLESCGSRIPSGVAIEHRSGFKPKANVIADWFWTAGGSLRRVAVLIERVNRDQLSISRFDMSVV